MCLEICNRLPGSRCREFTSLRRCLWMCMRLMSRDFTKKFADDLPRRPRARAEPKHERVLLCIFETHLRKMVTLAPGCDGGNTGRSGVAPCLEPASAEGGAPSSFLYVRVVSGSRACLQRFVAPSALSRVRRN